VNTTATNANATFYPSFVSATSGFNPVNVDSDMTYNPSTNTLTVANLTGLASNATQVRVQNTGMNSTHYLTFVDTFGTAQKDLQDTNGLSCNPNSASITATTFNGALSGTATNATNTGITATATDALFYPTFVSSTSGNLPQLVDSNFTYNPSNGDLSIPNTVKASGNIAVANSAFGLNAGLTSQGNFACAIGVNAGQTTQGAGAIAMGNNAGNASQGASSVAIGENAGVSTQGAGAIAIGVGAGNSSQSITAVALGDSAGQSSQGIASVAIGFEAGKTSQGLNAIAIGSGSGESTQGINTIAIGGSAGNFSQGDSSVAVGASAGQTNQGTNAVALGVSAGNSGQGTTSVAVGVGCANLNQGTASVAIGNSAGETTQGNNAVAIGNNAGNLNQGNSGVAIGFHSGLTGQGTSTVAVGQESGNLNQGAGAVAIGRQAGETGQGTNSIAIGNSAGHTNQHANSIILNASGSAVDSNGVSRFYVRPIRAVAVASPVLVYNTVTFEITYNTSSIKYKKNVIDLTGDTSAIYNIKAREYDSKDDDSHHIGYIAEELEECDTRFTWKNPDGSPEGIEWFHLLLYTIEEMKKLRERIAVLEAK
jgi:hypothetical protein